VGVTVPEVAGFSDVCAQFAFATLRFSLLQSYSTVPAFPVAPVRGVPRVGHTGARVVIKSPHVTYVWQR
jgi:hypothetical protein